MRTSDMVCSNYLCVKNSSNFLYYKKYVIFITK